MASKLYLSDFRFGSLADIEARPRNVRFTPKGVIF